MSDGIKIDFVHKLRIIEQNFDLETYVSFCAVFIEITNLKIGDNFWLLDFSKITNKVFFMRIENWQFGKLPWEGSSVCK